MECKRDTTLEAKIAQLVYGHHAKMVDVGFGLTLELIDKNAHTGTIRLIGGSWKKARTESGEIVELWLRSCPAWSLRLEDAWDLLQYCNKNAHDKYEQIILHLENILELESEAAAFLIAVAVENVYNNALAGVA